MGIGDEGFEGIEGTEAGGPRAVVGGAGGTNGGTDGTRAEGSSVYSAIGDRSPCGLSAAGSSSAGPGGGR